MVSRTVTLSDLPYVKSLAISLATITILCSAPIPSLADHPSLGLGGNTVGPVNSLSAETSPKGQWSIGLRPETVRFDPLSDQQLVDAAEQDQHLHSTDTLTSMAISAAYGLSDDLTLMARVPYVSREDIRQVEHHDESEGAVPGEPPEVVSLGDASGWGDMTAFAQYRLHHNPHTGSSLAIIAGLKMPTGKTSVIDANGERFETEHQPGSGSWDPLLGIAVTRSLESGSFSISGQYLWAGDGAQATSLGDRFFYHAALTHRLGETGEAHHHQHHGAPHGNWGAILELNGEWTDRVRVQDIADPNTGGHLLFLSPGLRYTFDSGLAFTGSVGLPVLQDLNGTQAVPDWRATLVLGYGF